MAVNTNGDFIKSVFSTLVSKKNAVFNALFANDSQDGTVEAIFNELEKTRKAWEVTGSNIYGQTDEQLEKTLALFSVLKKLPADTDKTILARLRLLFYRNGDTVWGNKQNVTGVFKTLFDTEKVYIVNNTETDSLLVNGNFEKTDGWTLEDGASYERDARFEGLTGVLLSTGGKVYQGVNVDADSTYFLHWFMKGALRVQIKDNNNRYWDADSGEFGAWGNVEIWKKYESKEWLNKDLYFITDSNVERVTVAFEFAEENGLLDYVRLNKKTKASTFSLVAVFDGQVSDETAVLAPGTDDPIENVDYEKMSYFDTNYISGISGTAQILLYQEILDIIQPAGVTSAMELLTCELDE